ncbi:MAG: DsrE family protein [Desulfobacterium sp.]|nr:DsrE family protein [Desulfobacterium sp.]
MTTKNRLTILWTNDNVITAEKMVFMYGINAKTRNWWDEVTIIIWGATVQLVSENKLIQDLIVEAKLEGVHVTVCKGCADQLGVTEILEGLNLEVIYQGLPLTQILKDDEKLITI